MLQLSETAKYLVEIERSWNSQQKIKNFSNCSIQKETS